MGLGKFDFSKTAEQPVTMELKNPIDGEILLNSEGQPMVFTLLSIESDAYKKAMRINRNARIRTQARAGRAIPKVEEIEADQFELTILCTRKWCGVEVEEGQPLEFTPDNVRMVYTKFPWVREQVEAFINDRANFLGNS